MNNYKLILKDVLKQSLFFLVPLLFSIHSVNAQLPDSTKRKMNFSVVPGLDFSGILGEGIDGIAPKFRFLVSHPIRQKLEISYGVDLHTYRYDKPFYIKKSQYNSPPGYYTYHYVGNSKELDHYLGIPILLSYEPHTKKWSVPVMIGLMPAFNWRDISYPPISSIIIEKGEGWALFTTASVGYLRKQELFDIGLSLTTNLNLVSNESLSKRQFSVGIQWVTKFHLNKPKRSTKK